MQSIHSIEAALLVDVTGGVARLTQRANDPAVLDAVTQLKSDLDSLVASTKNSQSSSMTAMLPMMMMMSRS